MPLPPVEAEGLAAVARWNEKLQIEKQNRAKIWQWVREQRQLQWEEDWREYSLEIYNRRRQQLQELLLLREQHRQDARRWEQQADHDRHDQASHQQAGHDRHDQAHRDGEASHVEMAQQWHWPSWEQARCMDREALEQHIQEQREAGYLQSEDEAVNFPAEPLLAEELQELLGDDRNIGWSGFWGGGRH